jgi:hypothetical protein
MQRLGAEERAVWSYLTREAGKRSGILRVGHWGKS